MPSLRHEARQTGSGNPGPGGNRLSQSGKLKENQPRGRAADLSLTLPSYSKALPAGLRTAACATRLSTTWWMRGPGP